LGFMRALLLRRAVEARNMLFPPAA
jgi:hypothetical protein